MANIASAKKRARQTVVRNARNRARVSRIRTSLRKVEEAITSGNKTEAQSLFQKAQPILHRGVGTGVLHKNTVARKLSRLVARIKAIV